MHRPSNSAALASLCLASWLFPYAGSADPEVGLPPIAEDDTYCQVVGEVIVAGAPPGVDPGVNPGVLDNDGTEPLGGELTATLDTELEAQYGIVALETDGSFIYTPDDLSKCNSDEFGYTAHLDGLPAGNATVALPCPEDLVILQNDTYYQLETIGTIVDAPGVLLNDETGPHIGVLTAILDAADLEPQSGIVELETDGSFSYTPNNISECSYDEFEYTTLLDGVAAGNAIVALPCLEDLFLIDDFEDGLISSESWIHGGNLTSEGDGSLVIAAVGNSSPGWAKSKEIDVIWGNTLVVYRELQIDPGGSGTFDGNLSFEIGSYPNRRFGVSYANYTETDPDGVTCETVGFSIFRNNANSHSCADKGVDVSDLIIPPIWNADFIEEIRYYTSTGLLEYYLDGVLSISYDVGILPGDSQIRLRLGTWAWNGAPGHSQTIDLISVTQVPPHS